MFDAMLSLILKPIALRKLNNGVPFAKQCGIRISSFNKFFANARMVSRPELLNKQGFFEAGALFTLAEAASGAAMTACLLPEMIKARPVVSKADFTVIDNFDGEAIATARVLAKPDSVLAELRQEGKVEFPVAVSVVDKSDGTIKAKMEAFWHVKLRS